MEDSVAVGVTETPFNRIMNGTELSCPSRTNGTSKRLECSLISQSLSPHTCQPIDQAFHMHYPLQQKKLKEEIQTSVEAGLVSKQSDSGVSHVLNHATIPPRHLNWCTQLLQAKESLRISMLKYVIHFNALIRMKDSSSELYKLQPSLLPLNHIFRDGILDITV